MRYETQVGASPEHAELLDLAEREDANSLSVMNALLDEGEEAEAQGSAELLQQTSITGELRGISTDLDRRWQGAIYALDPNNPDACRHFCSSAREILTQMVRLRAPDDEVLAMPSCEVVDGRPTRRARIRYLLSKTEMEVDSLEEFVERNIDNILELFRVLNSGAHGEAGKYDLPKLLAIKTRAEEGLLFMARIVS